MLTVPEAVRLIRELLAAAGIDVPADLYSQIKAAHPNGHMPQDWAEQWANTLINPAATGTHGDVYGGAATGLRRVK